MRFIILLLTTISLSISAVAQIPAEFSDEPGKFTNDVVKYLKSTNRPDCKETAERFETQFNAANFTPAQQTKVVEIGQLMLERKMRAFPYFHSYCNTIVNYGESGQNEETFLLWAAVLTDVTKAQRKGDNKAFLSFCDASAGFFGEGALYSSKAKTWVATSKKFTLVRDDEGKPKFIFPKTHLLAYTTGDTMFISNTSGEYFPLENQWVGSGGQVNWNRAGMDTNVVYGRFFDYKINLTKQSYTVPKAHFYFEVFFDKDYIEGSFEDKLVANNKPTTSTYPRFTSIKKDIEIDNLADNVYYKGGFNIHGSKIYGDGENGGKADLVFYLADGKTKALVARGDQIVIRKPVELNSSNTEIILYFGKDSIYHPGLDINFKIPNRELRIFRGKDGVSASAFADSYHNMEILTDALFWKLDKNSIEMSMIEGAGQKPALFQSNDFFDQSLFNRLRGGAPWEPLSRLKMYAEKYGVKEIHADTYAKQLNPNLSESQIKTLLYKMVETGFILYDDQTSIITIKDKTFNYVLQNARRMDYDIIQVRSLTNKINATINLENYDIDATGVKVIPISDSSEVYFFPKGKEVKIKADRDLQFSGLIFAGRMDLFGEGFYFNYDAFTTDLVKVDSMIINVPLGDRVGDDGKPILIPLKSAIEQMTGKLDINVPINKSGKSVLPQFPKLTSTDVSYVYYNQRRILGGIYPKDRFFFELKPFKIDSLKRFNADIISFEGTLSSAGIFEELEREIKKQPDLSLGFVTTTKGEAYPVYGGKGTFTDTITLNLDGLRGSGELNFLTSKLNSGDIVFFPDSLTTIAREFELAKSTSGPKTPQTKSTGTPIAWDPYGEKMNIEMGEEPFSMYEGQTTLIGDLTLTPEGLRGKGALDWDEAVLSSNQFEFTTDELEADTSKLEIKSIEGDRVTFNTPNVSSKVDFKERTGKFKSNLKDISTEFAYNQYKTAINEFDWDMDAKTLDFRAPAESQGAYFISTHSDQRSLKFLAKRAFYDLTTSIIEVEEIPEIIVADSKIIPGDGKATIYPEAVLDTFVDATIIGDTTNEGQKFEDVTVHVTGKHRMKGRGLYTYNTKGLDGQVIEVSEIAVEKNTVGGKKDKRDLYNVFGKSNLKEEKEFEVYKDVSFIGDAKITAAKQDLYFKGHAKVNFKNPKARTNWFTLDQDVDAQNLLIQLKEPKTPKGREIMAGIAFGKRDSSGMYTLLLDAPRSKTDVHVISAEGLLRKESSGTYVFGDSSRVFGDALQGNVVRYDDVNGIVKAEGALDLGLNLGAMGMVSAGKVTNKLNDNTYEFELTMGLNMLFEKDVNEYLGRLMAEENFDQPELDYDTEEFNRQMAELLEDKKEKKFFEELNNTGLPPRDKSLPHNWIITDTKFEYDPVERTLRSVGPIGISYVGDQGVHLKVKGHLEFIYRSTNSQFKMYLETSIKDWFFFEYKGSLLNVSSSFDDLNSMINAIDPDKRRVKSEDERYQYTYVVKPSKTAMKTFVERMKEIEKARKKK